MIQSDKILEILSYTLPSVITGAVAFYFFSKHIQHEENRRRFYLHKENQKQSFPLRLQAYERMVLFLERIDPNQLLTRVKPLSNDLDSYFQKLVSNVEQEFEHNLSQQIYMSDTCWSMIVTAKNTTLQLLRNKMADTHISTASELQEAILKEGINSAHPSAATITFIKSEVGELF